MSASAQNSSPSYDDLVESSLTELAEAESSSLADAPHLDDSLDSPTVAWFIAH